MCFKKKHAKFCLELESLETNGRDNKTMTSVCCSYPWFKFSFPLFSPKASWKSTQVRKPKALLTVTSGNFSDYTSTPEAMRMHKQASSCMMRFPK